jgi:hypothetical protein
LDRISTLLSSAPSDFSGTRSLFYFTPDYQVVVYYAAFAKRCANCESVVIVCLRIPNSAIESLSAPDIQRIYWPSNEWMELIWRCRTVKPLSSYLRKYRHAILVIGTLSRRPDSIYHAMNSWHQVTETCLLRVGPSGQGNPTIEYVSPEKKRDVSFSSKTVLETSKSFPILNPSLRRGLPPILPLTREVKA